MDDTAMSKHTHTHREKKRLVESSKIVQDRNEWLSLQKIREENDRLNECSRLGYTHTHTHTHTQFITSG